MGLLSRIKNAVASFRASGQSSRWYLNQQPFLGAYGGLQAAGVDVNPSTMISLSSVFAAVKMISEDLARLDLNVYQRQAVGRKLVADHPVSVLLNRRPNPYMTAMNCRQTLIASALLFGNSYAEIVRDGSGRALEIWPWENWNVSVQYDEKGRLYYLYQGKQYEHDDVLHLNDVTFNGIMGLAKHLTNREVIGVAIATMRHAGKYFENGARVPLALSTPESLMGKPQARKELENAFSNFFAGVDNHYKIPVVDGGRKLEPLDITDPEKSQLLQSRLFEVSEVARLFRVNPIKLGDNSKSSLNNVEQIGIQYVTETLCPWACRIEQEVNNNLFLPSEEMSFYVKHDLDDLMRGDSKSRAEVQQIRLMTGVTSVNEERSKDNLPPVEGGDVYTVRRDLIAITAIPLTPDQVDAKAPSNPVNPPNPVNQPKPQEPEEPEEDDPMEDPMMRVKQVASSFRSLITQEVGRWLRVEQDKVLRAWKKGEGFEAWRDSFYEQHKSHCVECLTPILATLASAAERQVDVVALTKEMVSQHVGASRFDLVDPDGLDQRVKGWDTRTDHFVSGVIERFLEVMK